MTNPLCPKTERERDEARAEVEALHEALRMEADRREAAEEQAERMKALVRECDSKAEKIGDPIELYQHRVGPWHRLLAITGTGMVEASEADLWRERAKEAEVEVERLLDSLRRAGGELEAR